MSFLQLSRELRDQIYELCIESATHGTVQVPRNAPNTLDYLASSLYNVLPMTGVNSQIRKEMLNTIAEKSDTTFFMQGDPYEVQHIDRFLEQFEPEDRNRIVSRPVKIRLGADRDVTEEFHPKAYRRTHVFGVARPERYSFESFLLALGRLRSVKHITLEFFTRSRVIGGMELHPNLRHLTSQMGVSYMNGVYHSIQEPTWRDWIGAGAREQNIALIMQGDGNVMAWDFQITGLHFVKSSTRATYSRKARELRQNERKYVDTLMVLEQRGTRPITNYSRGQDTKPLDNAEKHTRRAVTASRTEAVQEVLAHFGSAIGLLRGPTTYPFKSGGPSRKLTTQLIASTVIQK